jgi:hypothetical protein
MRSDTEMKRTAHHGLRGVHLVLWTPNLTPRGGVREKCGLQPKPHTARNAVAIVTLVERTIAVGCGRQHAHSPTITCDIFAAKPAQRSGTALRCEKCDELSASVVERDCLWRVAFHEAWSSGLTTQAQRRPRRRRWSAQCAHELPRHSNARRRGRSLQRMVRPQSRRLQN